MIELRIVSKSSKKIMEVAELLNEHSLAIDMNLIHSIERLNWEYSELKRTKIYMLTAKTKALLFNRIDTLLKKKYKGHMPELYSLPITYMDWEQTKILTTDVANV